MAQEKKNTKTHISEQIPSDCVSSVIKGRLPDTVSLGEDDSIIIIDQTKLPARNKADKTANAGGNIPRNKNSPGTRRTCHRCYSCICTLPCRKGNNKKNAGYKPRHIYC